VLNNLVGTFEQRHDETHLPIVARLRGAVPGIRDQVGARRRWLAGWN
jgi:hypothetical protein